MILGVGTDIVEVARFKSWESFQKKQLQHVFSERELDLFFEYKQINLQTLASRFAAKEAFYKAFSSSLLKLNLNKNDFSFLFCCKNIEILREEWDVPKFKLNRSAFEKKICSKLPDFNVELSISHEKKFALAFVIISE